MLVYNTHLLINMQGMNIKKKRSLNNFRTGNVYQHAKKPVGPHACNTHWSVPSRKTVGKNYFWGDVTTCRYRVQAQMSQSMAKPHDNRNYI
jgi:hypothetical protein